MSIGSQHARRSAGAPCLLWLAALLLASIGWSACAAEQPPVELVDTYHGDVDLADYWVSEKYDGVRGYWDGQRMRTRGGTVIDLPAWFSADFPDTALDGELWAGYDQFSTASAIVRTADAGDADWHQISYRVFDLPEHGGDFDARVPAIRQVVAAIDAPWVVAIRQFRVADDTALKQALARVMDRGGEGLVLHRGSREYAAGRGAGLLKVKPHADDEAKVIGMNPGHGRLQGLMGSLEVRAPDGRTFAIGSGFSDEQRADPPPVGSWITYRYNGETATGLPRFARFLHRRPGGPPPEVDNNSRQASSDDAPDGDG